MDFVTFAPSGNWMRSPGFQPGEGRAILQVSRKGVVKRRSSCQLLQNTPLASLSRLRLPCRHIICRSGFPILAGRECRADPPFQLDRPLAKRNAQRLPRLPMEYDDVAVSIYIKQAFQGLSIRCVDQPVPPLHPDNLAKRFPLTIPARTRASSPVSPARTPAARIICHGNPIITPTTAPTPRVKPARAGMSPFFGSSFAVNSSLVMTKSIYPGVTPCPSSAEMK